MIPYSRQLIQQDDIQAVVDTLNSDFLTTGPKVEEFEKKLAEYVGTKYAVVFNSATSALQSAYYCIDLQKDDEIITTPISFVATTNMMLHFGAKPIFVDIYKNGNINDTLIEEKITPKTKAIVSVDFAGNPVEYDKIKAIATKHNLHFISDSSHSLGAEFKGKKIGSLADMSIFSFHAVKPITTFEGGAVATNNEEYYKKLKQYCSHGIQRGELHKYDMVDMGYNFRLSDVASAIGISQLNKLDSFIEQREKIAYYYNDIFAYGEFFDILEIAPYKKSSYHLFPIFLKGALENKRDELYEELRKNGLGVQVHYRPIYQNSYYKKLFGDMSLENAEQFYKSELSLPCHQGITITQLKDIVSTLIQSIENVLGIVHDFTKAVDDTEDLIKVVHQDIDPSKIVYDENERY